jgi:hypothetical protein
MKILKILLFSFLVFICVIGIISIVLAHISNPIANPTFITIVVILASFAIISVSIYRIYKLSHAKIIIVSGSQESSQKNELYRPIKHIYDSNKICEYLKVALNKMDTTANYYRDEHEANHELVSTLKGMDVDSYYSYDLPNGQRGDAKVMGALVEGKLSPNSSEIDRLLRQIFGYMQYVNIMYIVIYGQLTENARFYIENEISSKYSNRVYLITLDSPHRLRGKYD